MVKNYVVGKTFYLIVACSIWIWIDGGYSIVYTSIVEVEVVAFRKGT